MPSNLADADEDVDLITAPREGDEGAFVTLTERYHALMLAYIQQTIDTLPPSQREVITLRDMKECTPEEVCDILSISSGNQRVLPHRARSKVRRALERYFGEG
jgi:RNA polymerase sigma factor (sigma-70 family)